MRPRFALFVVGFTLIGAPACGSLVGPDSLLAGAWSTGPIPSGGGIQVSLVTSGAVVSGSGQSRGAGPNGAISHITIAGSRSGDRFLLTFNFDSGIVATYSASLVDPDQLAGPWAVAGQPDGFLRLYRQ